MVCFSKQNLKTALYELQFPKTTEVQGVLVHVLVLNLKELLIGANYANNTFLFSGQSELAVYINNILIKFLGWF